MMIMMMFHLKGDAAFRQGRKRKGEREGNWLKEMRRRERNWRGETKMNLGYSLLEM